MRIKKAKFVCLGLLLCCITGCGKGPQIRLTYFRNAKYAVPSSVKHLGIAEFGSMSRTGQRWGEVASDRIETLLDIYNRKYGRYQLVDRRRIKAILDEKDLQMAISNSSTASRAGKMANCDAMIYGNVKLDTKDSRKSKSVYDYQLQRNKTVWYQHRYCMVSVNFTLDNINTGKTLASVSLTREYDSDKNRKQTNVLLGGVPDEPPPVDQIISDLIDQCVNEFIARISPHEVYFIEYLKKGKSDLSKTGNKLAKVGDYAEAMQYYMDGIKLVPDDHRTLFNIGLMYERSGDLESAENYYDQAFKLDDDDDYIRSRRRVQNERKGQR